MLLAGGRGKNKLVGLGKMGYLIEAAGTSVKSMGIYPDDKVIMEIKINQNNAIRF